MRTTKRSQGLTLIEMLITLGILAIMSAVALPSLMDTLSRMSVNSASRVFNNTLSLARSEAVKRGRNVSICPSASGTDCAAGVWSSGWIIFIDANGDANGSAGSVDAGDEVLRVFAPLGDVRLTVTPSTNLVAYDNKGFGAIAALLTFKLCPVDNVSRNARQVEVSLSGRPRSISTGVNCP